MKKQIGILVSLGLAGAFSAFAQTVISSGHVDIGVAYEGGALELHVHQEEPEEMEYEPGEAVLQLGPGSWLAGGVPNTPGATAFFGPAGSPLWVLSKTEDPELPFLGLGTEELEPGDWVGTLRLTLEEVRGPGDVFLWDVGAFGDLLPGFSTRDGVSGADAVDLEVGSHAHYFWGFSAPGDYEVVLSVSGQHSVDGLVGSESAAFRFQVVPEPGTGALVAVGLVVLAGCARRRGARGA